MMADDEAQRLLIVEDEEHLAAGLKLNLELEGYRVDVAANAKEAGQRLLDPSHAPRRQRFRPLQEIPRGGQLRTRDHADGALIS
jgi:hypothetical protein